MSTFSRRQMLSSLVAGGGAFMLGGALSPRTARAAPGANRRFVFAYFDGGWDLLLGLDPRSPATTNPADHLIEPGYDRLAAPYRNRGVQTAAGLTFGPAVPPRMLALAQHASVINGVLMDTASHEVGRRYFLTGRFPRGIEAVGSSAPAELVAQQGDQTAIPFLSAGTEAYASELPSFAGPFTINTLADVSLALTPFIQQDAAVLAAVHAFQDDPASCVGRQLDASGLGRQLTDSVARSRSFVTRQLDRLFDVTRTDAEMVALRARYGLTGADLGAPEFLAFAAGQAIKNDVSQAVSVRMAVTLDTHGQDWDQQIGRQERGWNALASLVEDLLATPSKSGTGTLLDDTTILCFSEFGRTPLFNQLRGRDHFLGNSALVLGAGFKKGLTVGQSAEVGMMPLGCELATGRGVATPTPMMIDSGDVVTLTPKHVLATVLKSAGVAPGFLRAAPIAALLP